MKNLNASGLYVDEIDEFERNEYLEKSIDYKTIINSITPKNYYQFSIALNSCVKKYNSTRDNIILSDIKDFLRIRHRYIEDHNFLSREEEFYLSNFKKYVHDLHCCLNNSINQYPIDYAIGQILDKIRMGYEINEIKNLVKLEHLHVIEETQWYIRLYQERYKISIIICNDGNKLNIEDSNNKLILIFTSHHSINLENIKNCTNIFDIYVKDENNYFIRLSIDSTLRSAAHLFFRFTRKINESRICISKIDEDEIHSLQDIFYQTDSYNFPPFGDTDLFAKIKELRSRVDRLKNILFAWPHIGYQELSNCSYFLKLSYGTLKFYADLDKKIIFCLNKIKKNNALYMKSGAGGDAKDLIFSEENFSSALGINLECLFYEHRFASVDCETRVGKGRSDIEIKINKKTISFIENKVVKFNDDPEKKIATGIDQLFARYSENYSINGDPSLRLYLILFSYDKKISDIENSIISALDSYSKRNGIIFTKHEQKENSMRFSYIRNALHFDKKLRFIDVISCNLELDAISRMSDRTKKSDYKL
jgi:hypothetical protein